MANLEFGPSFLNGDPHKSVYVAFVVRRRVLLCLMRAMLCIELARARDSTSSLLVSS